MTPPQRQKDHRMLFPTLPPPPVLDDADLVLPYFHSENPRLLVVVRCAVLGRVRGRSGHANDRALRRASELSCMCVVPPRMACDSVPCLTAAARRRPPTPFSPQVPDQDLWRAAVPIRSRGRCSGRDQDGALWTTRCGDDCHAAARMAMTGAVTREGRDQHLRSRRGTCSGLGQTPEWEGE